MKQYVIIGAGIAAAGCIEGIRSVDAESKIIMISGEGRPVYSRPLISYYLQGKTKLDNMKYRPDSFYAENDCEVIYAKARNIDCAAKTVALDNGQAVRYASLCVATGSSPFVPPFDGLETVERKFGFMTADDALALESAIDESSRVLIMGAGLIGLKCAQGICGRVKSVTVCDLAPRVLSSILDDACAGLMQKRLEEHGISFMLSDSAQRFDKNTAYMKSGKRVFFDVLVLAVGVRPSVSLVRDAGGECDRGITVDTGMKTSLDCVYAAGDCTQGYDASAGEKRVLAILPNAYMQGECAGINMAGGSRIFDTAIPMNSVGFFGLHALTAGSFSGEMRELRTENSVKRLFVRDGTLVGFMMIGETRAAGIYTAMIREKTPIDTLELEKLMETPSLIAFSPEKRRKTLGGVV